MLSRFSDVCAIVCPNLSWVLMCTTCVGCFVVSICWSVFIDIKVLLVKQGENTKKEMTETRYSTKVPLMAIRVMAGFEKGGGYCLPRGMVQPKDELVGMMLAEEKEKHPTARSEGDQGQEKGGPGLARTGSSS
jgi:hypothetical protein